MSRVRMGLCAAAYMVISLAIMIPAIEHPEKNWDMIPYVGAALSNDYTDKQAWYEHTIAVAKSHYTEEVGRTFIHQNGLIKDVESLLQQMPLYNAKPFYVSMVYVLYKTGLDPAYATYLISQLAILILLLLLGLCRPGDMNRGVWWLASAAFFYLYAQQVTYLASLSTPDALALLWVVLSFYALLVWRWKYGWAIFAILATLTRPDSWVLVSFFAAIRFMFAAGACRVQFDRSGFIYAVAIMALTMVYYLYISQHYGWHILLEFQFVDKVAYVAELTGEAITLERYLALFSAAMQHMFSDPRSWGLILWVLSVVIIYLSYNDLRKWQLLAVLLFCPCYVIYRLAIFPSYSGRFIYPAHLVAWLSGACFVLPALTHMYSRVINRGNPTQYE